MSRFPFSERTSWDRTENQLARLLEEARSAGRQLTDLTESNPTRCGIARTDDLIASLGDARGASYEPQPLGHPEARAAVARYYAERGLAVDPDRVVLTASTSEGYGWLFKLLCERDGTVLVPSPSYPLFDFLADLEDVRLIRYPLVAEEGWRIDLGALERSIEPSARAILCVHPNNPTGSFVRRDEAEALEDLASRRGLALVVDEVFGDYAHGDLAPDRLASFVGARRALTFVLSGLSKVVLMPQVKLGWIVCSGPDDLVGEAMRRLEIVADTYLSVGTPVQLALGTIFGHRARLQRAALERVTQNLAALDAALASVGPGAPVRRMPVDGGWYAILEVPRTRSEDEWVERLVSAEGIVVHPGYFFDMPAEGFLVVSLLSELWPFVDAASRMVRALSAE